MIEFQCKRCHWVRLEHHDFNADQPHDCICEACKQKPTVRKPAVIEKIWGAIARYLSQEERANALIQRSLRTPYFHLPSNEEPTYMGRYWLFNPYDRETNVPKFWWCPWSVRIHHIKRADNERHLHDHPWNARTIILKGWYEEKRMIDLPQAQIQPLLELFPDLVRNGKVEAYEYTRRRQGDTATLSFEQYHSIVEVSPGGVWTLFISSRWQGVWGFLVDGVKIPWREYLGIDGHPNKPKTHTPEEDHH